MRHSIIQAFLALATLGEATFTFSSPETSWTVGQSNTIKYESTELDGDVDLYLAPPEATSYTDAGAIQIATQVKNTGSVNWTPDGSYSRNSACLIAVDKNKKITKSTNTIIVIITGGGKGGNGGNDIVCKYGEEEYYDDNNDNNQYNGQTYNHGDKGDNNNDKDDKDKNKDKYKDHGKKKCRPSQPPQQPPYQPSQPPYQPSQPPYQPSQPPYQPPVHISTTTRAPPVVTPQPPPPPPPANPIKTTTLVPIVPYPIPPKQSTTLVVAPPPPPTGTVSRPSASATQPPLFTGAADSIRGAKSNTILAGGLVGIFVFGLI